MIGYQFNWTNVIFLNKKILKEDIKQSIPDFVYDILYPPPYYSSPTIRIDSMEVKISGDQYMLFMEVRKIGFLDKYYRGEIGMWFSDSMKNQYFDIRTNFGKAKIKWIGLNIDHFGNPNRFNFRLNMKNENRFHGYDKLNIMKPLSRRWIVDRVANEVFKKFEGVYIPSIPVHVVFNKKQFGTYLAEPHMSKQLLELNRLRDGELSEIYVLNYNNVEIKMFNSLGRDVKFKNWIKSHIENQNYEAIIDKDKLLMGLTISYVLGSYHNLGADNLKWYYNPVSNRLEPILRELIIQETKDEGSIDHYYTTHLEENTWPSSLERLYIQENFSIEKFSREIQNRIPQVIETLEKYMSSDDYREYVSKLGPKNRKEIRSQEKKILERTNIVENNLNTDNFQINSAVNDNTTHTVLIKNDTIISRDTHFENLIVLEDVTLTLNNAVIYIDGDLRMNGTSTKQITITSNDTLSSLIVSNSKYSILKYVNFNGLANLARGFHQLPSAITFYNCNKVEMTDCRFTNNSRGDDYINFFKVEKFKVENCVFQNVKNDAIDSDFSNGIIDNSIFVQIGNDAIDGSGSKLHITNTKFDYVYDKAISAGEKSKFFIKSVSITNSEIGFVSKDLSEVYCENIISLNNKLDFAVFQKKPEFGPGKLLIDADIGDYKYLFQKGSLVGNTEGLNFVKNVENLLYGNQFGRATN